MPAKSVAEIAAVVRAGGGLTVNAATFSAADLCVIAKAAGEGRARLLLVQAGRLKQPDLVSIAAAGKGSVAFEFQSLVTRTRR